VVDYGNGQDQTLDFLSGRSPLARFDLIATNPPYGKQAALATAFVEVGLAHIRDNRAGAMALLMLCDFDSGKTRARYFADCPHFVGKIVLTERIVFFKRSDGEREGPKENHAWFLWARSLLRVRRPPVILYAPNGEAR
jgi:hypothetical protein